MKTVARLFIVSICGLFLSSCIQHSTVLRVRKDGSGEIFVRNHFSPQMTGMLAGMAAQAGADPNVTVEGDMDITNPDPEELKADAAKYGEGVRYARHEANKNKEGWEGFLVVYEFDDISKVKLDGDSAMPSSLTEMAEEQGQEMDQDTGEITFSMADGVLTMRSTMGSAGVDSFKEQGAGEDLPEGMKPSQQMAPMAGMFAGMRMGYFIRIEGGIAETNATHVNGDFITMSDMDMGKTLTDPAFLAFIDEAAATPDAITEEKVNTLVEEVEGMTAEMQKEVTVKFN